MRTLLVVISPDEKLRSKLPKHFNHYRLLEIENLEPEEYYRVANSTIRACKHAKNVFLIPNGNPAFCTLLAAKLAQEIPQFYLAEWTGVRFRVLEVP